MSVRCFEAELANASMSSSRRSTTASAIATLLSGAPVAVHGVNVLRVAVEEFLQRNLQLCAHVTLRAHVTALAFADDLMLLQSTKVDIAGLQSPLQIETSQVWVLLLGPPSFQ